MVPSTSFWRSWFFEPLTWLLRCFFQPAGFQREVERETIGARLYLMSRLLLPLFCCTFPPALLFRTLLYLCFPSAYSGYSFHAFSLFQPTYLLFAFDCLWATAVSCLIGGYFGSLFSVVYGVALALASALANGIIVNNSEDTQVVVVFGLCFGCFFGLAFNTISLIKRRGLLKTTVGSAIGMLAGMLSGLLTGLFGGYYSGLLVGLIGGPSLQQSQSIAGSVAGILFGGIIGSLLVGVVGSIVRSSMRANSEVVEASTRLGVAVAGAFGVAIGTPVGDIGMKQGSLVLAVSSGWLDALIVALAFLLSYAPSYYRLPLYPLSALSMLRAYRSSSKNPSRIIYDLHHCALFFDECVFLPLPYVRPLLLLAAEQDIESALKEIDFLLHERAQQRSAVQAAVLEIALNDLCFCESLRDISRAHLRLPMTLPHEVRLLDQGIARLFLHLEDASRDAASYYSRTNRQARYEALERMLSHLQRVYPAALFHEPLLNRRLEELVQRWRMVAKHEQENVLHDDEEFGSISNPYMPGLVLELRDPLFVGRQDLAQQLSEALLRSRRPTFFLSGERRMGKSSILKQLPDLLGSQYLPIFYDLQSTGIASSTAALLAALAEGIYELLMARGILVKKLEYEQLREDQRQNEAVVYHRFGRWLKDVEYLLEQESRVLLLAFDEFEKLEEAGLKGYLDLDLLLNWLRSLIQNHPRVALLFSGVKSVNEMGTNWSGYFVNVETLKVSFLLPTEARRLITRPVSHFPGERIFPNPVVEAIIQVTGCHPFLIQALCSVIITRLNASVREQAELTDLSHALDEVFNKWEDNYFYDLWLRSDEEQRLCLRSLLTLTSAPWEAISAHSGLNALSVRRALQRLQKRDIVLCVQDSYCLSAPIFKLWVQRSL